VVRGGWTQLVGSAYERRIYAFRFDTTEAQDDAFIAQMNASRNRSHFNLLFDNCSDFARRNLDFYFPGAFRRSIFPDAGITTPVQIAQKLKRYAGKHPGMQLTVFEIPQIPGYRRSHRDFESLSGRRNFRGLSGARPLPSHPPESTDRGAGESMGVDSTAPRREEFRQRGCADSQCRGWRFGGNRDQPNGRLWPDRKQGCE
jgi:hypothetical protein